MQTKFPSRQRARWALKIKATFLRPEGCDPPRTKAAPSPPYTTHSAPPGFQGALGAEGVSGATGRRPDPRRRSRPAPTPPLRPRSAWGGRPGSQNAGSPALPSPRPLPSLHRGLPAPLRPRGSIAASPARPCPARATTQAARPPSRPLALPSSRLGPAPRPGLPPHRSAAAAPGQRLLRRAWAASGHRQPGEGTRRGPT